MKKLLTVLLTIVMAVCLVNLNNSQTKAEDNIDDTNVSCNGIKTNGTIWKNGSTNISSTDAKNTFGVSLTGDTFAFSNSLDTSSEDNNVFNIYDMWGLYNAVLGNDVTLELKNTSSTKSPIESTANLVFNGNGNKLTLISTSGSALISDSSAYYNKRLKNIKLVCKSNNSGYNGTVYFETLYLDDDKVEMEISNTNSSGHALRVESEPSSETVKGEYEFLGSTSATPASPSVLKVAVRASNGIYQVNTGTEASPNWENAKYVLVRPKVTPKPEQGEMPYDETNGFTSTITKGSASTLTAHIANATTSDTVEVKEGATTLTVNNQYKIESGSIKVVFQQSYLNNMSPGPHSLSIKVTHGGRDYTFPVNINVDSPSPSPTPSPSPSKKDESCEKVIGPTWHWNNDKGICEDYGVVGTSTR